MRTMIFAAGLAAVLAPWGTARAEPGAEEKPVAAPEFPRGTRWLQSKPLTLAELRGKVVVVHFWTFGCENCMNNYPAYKAWQQKYTGKDVVLLGIHTPETPYESHLPRVSASARKNGLKFPIAVDNSKQLWKAWKNRYWPTVYLVDRKGLIRCRWEGELSSEMVQGEQLLRRKIDELLAEKE
jgi:thiol-disulfide isomerase/thioredoxin